MILVYSFEQMSDEQAQELAAWRYDPPYDFYDMPSDPEDLEELLALERRRNYYAAVSGGEDYADDSAIDVGLGLRPDLAAKGLGLGFVLAGLEFAEDRFDPSGFRLSVATFNERAGFWSTGTFASNKGDRFLIMVREG